MRSLTNFFIILVAIFFVLAFSMDRLHFFSYKNKDSFDSDGFANTLNAALDAKNEDSPPLANANPLPGDRSPASADDELENENSNYTVLSNYNAVPNAEANDSLIPRTEVNGFSVFNGRKNRNSLIVKNNRTGRLGVFTRRIKIRYLDDAAFSTLTQDPRLVIDSHFPEINLAIVHLSNPSEYFEIKKWLKTQAGIVNAEYEIIENRPEVPR